MRELISLEVLQDEVRRRAEGLVNEFSGKTDYQFQPIVDVRDGRHEVYGYEALLRTKGEGPESFIKKLRKEGRGHDLELLSFYAGIVRFEERGLSGMVFINSLPHETLSLPELAYLEKRRTVYERRVIVENLEDDVLFDAAALLKKKERFENFGYRIALDDYGTGINSVRALKLFKPEIVKIDKSYVSGANMDCGRSNSLEIMIDEIKSQGAMVLAEGVETWSEYETLRYMGVDFMQGFYLGGPE
ncbi:MAG TPA: hypothetical protein DCL38_06855 [Lachnospiraceae bacterium]|nr:hypothetical protein [Lachnospiraceae bacterium]